jgi:hypothetical protein
VRWGLALTHSQEPRYRAACGHALRASQASAECVIADPSSSRSSRPPHPALLMGCEEYAVYAVMRVVAALKASCVISGPDSAPQDLTALSNYQQQVERGINLATHRPSTHGLSRDPSSQIRSITR